MNKNKEDFTFKVDEYELMRKKSDGTWYCNPCNQPAETEHNKEECHLCSDWNGCGKDCTLSRIFCKKCGTSKSF